MTASHSLSAVRPANNMTLTSVTRGRIQKPPRVLLYGVEKIGKSTFASCAPAPIFLCSEKGTAELDVARFPEPTRWEEVRYAIDTLCREKHEYQTFVIDTLDWLEPLCWREVCSLGKVVDIEDYGGGYGKWTDAARGVWRVLLEELDELQEKRNMGIILLAHSWVKAFNNPEGENYDRYELKLHAKSSTLIKEWCDAVLFATFETFAVKSKGGKAKGVSDGARIVHTQRRGAWDAGNRYDLPETLPLDWEAFADGMKARQSETPEALKERIGKMLESVKEPKWHAKVTAAVSAAGEDAMELARIANKLSAMLQPKGKDD